MQQDARSIPVVIDGRTHKVVNNDQKMAGGGLEGAEKLSREMLSWQPAIISPDQQIAADKEMADARTSDAVQNIGMMRGASATHKDSIVGAVYRLNAKPNVEALLGYGATDEWADEFQVAVESRFNLIADSPNNWLDASRMNTLTSMVRLAIGVYFVHGEVLATAADRLRHSGHSHAVPAVHVARVCVLIGTLPFTAAISGLRINNFRADKVLISSAPPSTRRTSFHRRLSMSRSACVSNSVLVACRYSERGRGNCTTRKASI